jgi:hypothetical protein
MNRLSNKKSLKSILSVSVIATLLIAVMTMTSTTNAYASIFENIRNADDIGQSLECVIVVVGCDGTGSVGSSGDTIIGSNNGNDDDNTNGEEPPNTPGDVVICHRAPGNPSQTQTLSLSQNAADAHLEQHEFDTEGPCPAIA